MNIRDPGEFLGAFLRTFATRPLAAHSHANLLPLVQLQAKRIKKREEEGKKKRNERLRIISPYVTDLSTARGVTYSSLIGRTGRKYSHKAKNKQRGAEILR